MNRNVKTLPKRLAGLLLTLWIAAGFSAAAQAETTEEALTVAFLYNFLKFSQWPNAENMKEINLCVSGRTDFDKELEAINGRQAQDRVVKISKIDLGENYQQCQLLFLAREEKPVRIAEWLKEARNRPVMLVSDAEDFLDAGGMIALVKDDARLQFEVNIERVRDAGLSLNAELLRLARDVRGK